MRWQHPLPNCIIGSHQPYVDGMTDAFGILAFPQLRCSGDNNSPTENNFPWKLITKAGINHLEVEMLNLYYS